MSQRRCSAKQNVPVECSLESVMLALFRNCRKNSPCVGGSRLPEACMSLLDFVTGKTQVSNRILPSESGLLVNFLLKLLALPVGKNCMHKGRRWPAPGMST